jgi:hypothetical protein
MKQAVMVCQADEQIIGAIGASGARRLTRTPA